MFMHSLPLALRILILTGFFTGYGHQLLAQFEDHHHHQECVPTHECGHGHDHQEDGSDDDPVNDDQSDCCSECGPLAGIAANLMVPSIYGHVERLDAPVLSIFHGQRNDRVEHPPRRVS